MQDGQKAVWSIPYVSVVSFFPSLKQNFSAYRSSKVSDCIFEIHQLWQSGFSRVYSNSFCSCSFEPKIIKIGWSCHKMYSNNILNVQESTTILNACTKKSVNILNALRTYSLSDKYPWKRCGPLIPTPSDLAIGIMIRVFTNCSGDQSSIPDRVIPKTQKWYLILPSLTHSNITYVSKEK